MLRLPQNSKYTRRSYNSARPRPQPPRGGGHLQLRPSPAVSRPFTAGTASSTHPLSSSHISYLVEDVAGALPHQGILENFVHHNPLEHLQTLRFSEAVKHVRNLESYMSPGERVLTLVHVDPRKRANEALVDLCSAFLDRGAAKWTTNNRDKGFLYFFASLEGLGFAPWRKYARTVARRVLDSFESDTQLADSILKENLEFFGIPQEEWQNAIRSTLLDLRGWAGMFRRMETHSREVPLNAKVRLIDFCVVQFILTRSSIEALARQLDWNPSTPFSTWLSRAPLRRPEASYEGPHPSAIASIDQTAERRELLETQVEKTLLGAIASSSKTSAATSSATAATQRPTLQLYTCIDDRECSFRRHIEEFQPSGIETFGVAGFFGIPIRYQPADGRDQMILAPEGQDPTALVIEGELSHQSAQRKRRRRFLAQFSRFWEAASFSPLGSALLSGLIPLTLSRLWLMGFNPSIKTTVKDLFKSKVLPSTKTDFTLPFAPEQAASMLARTFKDVGTQDRFAPLIIVVGHGASSVNNPFAAAYNCGACGGRDGGPNARLLARMANDKSVRHVLATQFNVHIPEDTIFVGGIHNTTTDRVQFFDVDSLPSSHQLGFEMARRYVEIAAGKNALERCHRFLLATGVRTPEEALKHVQTRAIDPAEARPELNHATNGAVVLGRRDLTKGKFLNRRVFLPSYDPLSDDAIGTNLEHVLAPALIVCSGINLEYLFSTIEVEQYGAGTKAPLNVVGNIGVLQGTAGDLRPGLPTQMTEMHLPVRALFVVDTPIDRVEAVLNRRPDLKLLVRNEWVRFIVRDPATGQFYRQSNGEYLLISPSEIENSQPTPTNPNGTRIGEPVAKREALIYWASIVGMLLSCAGPLYFVSSASMLNPFGPLIAICGTLLALPVLAFSRRYLHGDYMFGRFAMLSVSLLLGFNLVSTATTLEQIMLGWSLFGFASTFLIGAYNDRPTVRNNATYAFAAYRISDMALLVATALTAHHIGPAYAAGALLLAALFKSSQFPLTSLFVRSMEGPTPASALGYAGLSAHVGVVLLTSTLPLWFGFDWARLLLATTGLATAIYGTLVSKIRSDRKGAVANATSATLGLIFIILAAGFPNLALTMSLGHAAFRMIQILRAPNVISDAQNLRSALGFAPWPTVVPDWKYRFAWALRRYDTDFHLIHTLHRISRRLLTVWPKSRKLTKLQQWFVLSVGVVIAGAPFTPVSHYLDEVLMELVVSHPFLSALIMAGHFGVAVVVIRFLFVNVLHSRRFHKNNVQLTTTPK